MFLFEKKTVIIIAAEICFNKLYFFQPSLNIMKRNVDVISKSKLIKKWVCYCLIHNDTLKQGCLRKSDENISVFLSKYLSFPI